MFLMEKYQKLMSLEDSLHRVKESFSRDISEIRSKLKEVVDHVMALNSRNSNQVVPTSLPHQTTEV